MIGILCVVIELIDLVSLRPYGSWVRPCVEQESSLSQVQYVCREESVPFSVEQSKLPMTTA